MDLLGLDDFRVLAVDEQTHDFHFQVVLIAPPLQCVHCGHNKLHRHERKSQLFMDLPIRGKRVGIIVQRHRFLCRACRRTFIEPLPAMNESHFMTNRLISYIRAEALRRTFASIADETGQVESTIRVLFSEFAATIQPSFPDNELLYLGIDELYLLHQFCCSKNVFRMSRDEQRNIRLKESMAIRSQLKHFTTKHDELHLRSLRK